MSTLFTVHTSSLHTQVMYITECFFPPSQYIGGLVLHCIPHFITQGLLLNSVLHIQHWLVLQVTYSSTLKPSGTINSDDSVDCRSTSTVDLTQFHLRTLVVSSPPWMVSPIEAATGTAHLGWKGAHIAVDIAIGWGGGEPLCPLFLRHFPSRKLSLAQLQFVIASPHHWQAHKHTSTQAHKPKY